MAVNIVHYIKELMKENGISEKQSTSLDTEELCEQMGMESGALIKVLLGLVIRESQKAFQFRHAVNVLLRENELLEKTLDTAYRGNGRLKRQAMVQSGLKVAEKQKKDLAGLRMLMYLGKTDKELMEEYEISRTTLWRWKKELEEEQSRIDMIIRGS